MYVDCRLLSKALPRGKNLLVAHMFSASLSFGQCVCVCVCVRACLLQMKKIAKMKGPGLGLVCCRLCVMSFARCRMKLPPPLLTPTFPLWPCCSGRFNKWETRRGEEWPRCNQQTLWAPSWVPVSCLYACLIGQKQHGWLCSQGIDIKDLAYPHMSSLSRLSLSSVYLWFYFVLESAVTDCVLPPCISAMCVLGHVYCQSSANHPLLCITREPAWATRLLSLQIGLSALLLLCCDMVSAYFQDGWIMLSSIWPTI